MLRRFDPQIVHSPLSSLSQPHKAKKWNIPLHATKEHDTLNSVTGKSIKVIGQVMMEATFNNKTCYFDCLVTTGLQNEILISWHDAEAIGAVSFTQNDKKDLPGCGHVKDKAEVFVQHTEAKIEEIKKLLIEKYPNVLRDKLPSDYDMRGPKVHITLSPECPKNPKKAKTATLVPIMYRAIQKK